MLDAGNLFLAEKGHFAKLSYDPKQTVYDRISHFGELSKDVQPLRQDVGIKLLKMSFIKQFEDALELYDCVDEHLDEQLEARSEALTTFKETQGKIGAGLGIMAAMAFIKYKKLPILHFDSYIANIYYLPVIYGVTFSFWKMFSGVITTIRHFEKEQCILSSKAQLHSNIFRLTNDLKHSEALPYY